MSELDRYDYHLPPHLIAEQPVHSRIDARLLVVNRKAQTIEHRHIRDLPEFLRAGDCLVINETKVIPARLVGFRTQTGGRWEGLFLESQDNGFWLIMGHTRGKLQPGETLTLLDRAGKEAFTLELISKSSDGNWIVKPTVSEAPYSLLERVGRVPLPPYIRDGEMAPGDQEQYQTVFARVPGSVAAPTAGLHFTDSLLLKLQKQGIEVVRITLHVGLGTFRPISGETLDGHKMHSEWGCIDSASVQTIQNCQHRGGRVIAVGTTSVRLLETASATGDLQPFSGPTDLFIRPPYNFRTVECMLTNFHLPKTTLFVLVCTLAGDELIHKAYQDAIAEGYRFYSYGDAMLIL